MTAATPTPVGVDRSTIGVARGGLVALGALALLGAGTELAATGGGIPLAPAAGVAILAAATVLVVAPGPRSLPWARVLCLLVLGAAAYGVAEHLVWGADPAAVDAGISAYWASLSPLTRSWHGAGGLGRHTPLAPGMLGQAALFLLLATLGRRSTAGGSEAAR